MKEYRLGVFATDNHLISLSLSLFIEFLLETKGGLVLLVYRSYARKQRQVASSHSGLGPI